MFVRLFLFMFCASKVIHAPRLKNLEQNKQADFVSLLSDSQRQMIILYEKCDFKISKGVVSAFEKNTDKLLFKIFLRRTLIIAWEEDECARIFPVGRIQTWSLDSYDESMDVLKLLFDNGEYFTLQLNRVS